ncbi:MAG: preprotein translocase subunit SecE [Actinomycetota bacterium]|nr:MAG: preprotein translocase subunit SecE [Actinomycetota bacterium]
MNRQTKRMMERRQGGADPGAAATAARHQAAARTAGADKRTTFRGYLSEVRTELRKVIWPKRHQVINYSTVVFFTLVFLVALIFVLNFAFSKAVLFLYK